ATLAYPVTSCHFRLSLLSVFTIRPHPSSTLFPYTTLFRSRCRSRSAQGRSRPSPFPRPRARLPLLVGPASHRSSDGGPSAGVDRSEEHTSELQSRFDLVCRLLLEKKKEDKTTTTHNPEPKS